MEWYYARDGQQLGPVNDQTFERLRISGTISDATLVWNSSMTDWQPLGEILASVPPLPGAEVLEFCRACGRAVNPDELLRFRDDVVCPECKDVYFLGVYQGTAAPGAMSFAPMWKRFLARVLDMVICSAATGLFSAILTPLLFAFDMSEEAAVGLFALFYLFSFALQIVYETWFTGRFAATPGKMALGLIVVTEDGSKVSYLRAFGRFFANILSASILYVGYLIAIPDVQKRTLHDYICSTRVIMKAPQR
ncbi:MAG: RDD family protein [Candidatus Hydrogenedentes bacterium]|nr:RDD family protein [Candidatus Hydrogenedentota bacterium]